MDVKRLVQSRADKVFQHVGKVEKDKTFPDGGGLYVEVASR